MGGARRDGTPPPRTHPRHPRPTEPNTPPQSANMKGGATDRVGPPIGLGASCEKVPLAWCRHEAGTDERLLRQRIYQVPRGRGSTGEMRVRFKELVPTNLTEPAHPRPWSPLQPTPCTSPSPGSRAHTASPPRPPCRRRLQRRRREQLSRQLRDEHPSTPTRAADVVCTASSVAQALPGRPLAQCGHGGGAAPEERREREVTYAACAAPERPQPPRGRRRARAPGTRQAGIKDWQQQQQQGAGRAGGEDLLALGVGEGGGV